MLSLAVLLLLTAGVAADADYCNISSCGSWLANHTLCLYPRNETAALCGTVVERGVSAGDREEILRAHNDIRQDVRRGVYVNQNLPAALEMPDLTWDPELATVAQRWADQCDFKHDKCRDVPRFVVGQNLAVTFGYPKSWTSNAVGQWFFGELPLFQQQDLTFTPNQGTGHLTQTIWAKTSVVGCGFIAVEDSKIFPGYTLVKRTYVCNYGPSGNFVGAQIYLPA